MENNTKHTPGPWVIKPINDGFHDGKAFIFGPQLDKSKYRPAPVVMLIEKPCKDKDEHAANLALCAAAPELLAALERVLECHRLKISLDTNAGAVEQARAAIAKAKGESC